MPSGLSGTWIYTKKADIQKDIDHRMNSGFPICTQESSRPLRGSLLSTSSGAECTKSEPISEFGFAHLSGPEGNRTPVRKSIPCSSTIIVCYFSFPPPSENRHPDGFSSFILRPQAQSFACVVSRIVDARFFMCGCTKADSRCD